MLNKIIEFISVLVTVSGEVVEKEYSHNNFIHHHIEQIIDFCLESKKNSLIQHILEACHLVSKILDAEKNCALNSDPKNETCYTS